LYTPEGAGLWSTPGALTVLALESATTCKLYNYAPIEPYVTLAKLGVDMVIFYRNIGRQRLRSFGEVL